MGERQITCGSANNPTEYQEEYRNGRRNEERKRYYFFFFLCFSMVLLAPQWSSAGEEQCKSKLRCWHREPTKDISFKDGLFVKEIDKEKTCKAICYNNEICIGAYWGFKSSKVGCWLQMPSNGVSDSLTKARHWTFANCTDDCLWYCWKPKATKVRTQGRKIYSLAQTEDQCKETCSRDSMCDGVDWNPPNKSCWHDFRHVRARPTDPIQHWEIIRNTQKKCSRVEEQCMPHCWTETETPDEKLQNAQQMGELKSADDCKDFCINHPQCIGVYWGSSDTCWLQMSFRVEAKPLTNTKYWTLSKCSDDCFPYCWVPKLEHVIMNGGMPQKGINEESRCKVKCAHDKTCAGADFNPNDKTCWNFRNEGLLTSPVTDPIDQWEIVRNLPRICSDEANGVYEPDLTEDETIENAPTENAAIENAPTENAATETAPTAEATTKEVPTTEITSTETVTESPERCKRRCWQKTLSEDISFKDGQFMNGTGNETECKQLCANSETCVGVYWGFNTNMSLVGCWLQLSSHGVSDSLTNANHWNLSNCTDDCFSYCWKPKVVNVQTLGGVYKHNVTTEVQCKKMCADDHLCDGADYNSVDVSCWLLFKHRRTPDPVYHWEIIRNLPTNCSKSEEQCTPRCWNKTVLSDVTFNDGQLKKGINSENDCKEFCGNNQTCIGVYWGSDSNSVEGNCWFQMPYQGIASASLKNASRWSLLNCTDDCLPYCWMPKWDFIQTAGGTCQSTRDENQCKVQCANDQKCQGIDFNATTPSCWLLHDLQLIVSPTSDPVHHWEIERHLPMVCSNAKPEPSVVSTPPAPEETEGTEEPEEIEEPEEVSTETAETEEPLTTPEAKQAPSVGESIVEPRKSHSPKRRPSRANCPSYLLGMMTMVVLLGVCVVTIIGLVVFIGSRTLHEEEIRAASTQK